MENYSSASKNKHCTNLEYDNTIQFGKSSSQLNYEKSREKIRMTTTWGASHHLITNKHNDPFSDIPQIE